MLPEATRNIRLPVWSSLIDRRQLAQLAKYCKQFGAITTLPNLAKLVPASISTGLLIQGDVGAKTIALKLDGKPLTALLAGDYTFVVSDRSAKQNFHLKGPGLDKKTGRAAGGPAELHDEAGEGPLHLLERCESEAEGHVPGHVSPNLRVRGRTAHPEASHLSGHSSTMRVMATRARTETGSGQSQSLERGLAILSAFKPATPELGISELARELGLTRSTSHRYVATLARLGYLQQNPQSRKYRLGPRVLDLGFSAINSMELREIAAHAPPAALRRDRPHGEHGDPRRDGHRVHRALPEPAAGPAGDRPQPPRRLAAAGVLHVDGEGAARRPARRPSATWCSTRSSSSSAARTR